LFSFAGLCLVMLMVLRAQPIHEMMAATSNVHKQVVIS
jgi:hypothetical protein